MRSILLIAQKDLKVLLKDRKALLMLLLMPILLTAILGAALKGMMGEASMPETIVGVYSVESNALMDNVLNLLSDESLAITAKQATSNQQLEQWIEKKTVHVGVHVPQGWGMEGQDERVVVRAIAGQEPAGMVIRQFFETHAQTSNTVATATRKVMEEAALAQAAGKEVDTGMLQACMGESVQHVVSKQHDYVQEKSVGEKPVSAMQYYAAAMAAMFLLFNAMQGGKSFHKERQMETMARLLMTPISVTTLLAGKFLGTFLFALFQFTLFMFATRFLLQVEWGANLEQTVFIACFYCFAVAGLSMIVASFTSSEKTADVVGSLGVQVMALLGGSMLPLSLFPDALRKIAMLTPNSWALTSFTSIMSGTEWSSIWRAAAIFFAIGLVAVIVSGVKCKRQVL